MHLKHRPKTWDDFIGNEPIIKSLHWQLQGNGPFLFTGERGCGKTTLAYLAAKEFGANDQTITEVNCGSYRKLDDMRELIDSFSRSSLFGKRKCYILDELHRLPEAHAQSALLTPLENLDSSVLVIGCTTDVSGLMNTFLERFVRFKVKPLSDKESFILLKRICEKENIDLPKWLIALIIEQSKGIPRNLLTGLSTVQHIEDEKEAQYLLEVSKLYDFNEDVLTLFKAVLSEENWKTIKRILNVCLKTEDPVGIAKGLIGITASRVMSNYYKDSDRERLLCVYHNMNEVRSRQDLIMKLLSINEFRPLSLTWPNGPVAPIG